MSFQENVKKLMCEYDINQKELSKRSGVSEASLCRYLSGSITPRVDIVENIAKVFGVSIEELIGDLCFISNDSFDETFSIVTRNCNKLTNEQKAKIIEALFGGND